MEWEIAIYVFEFLSPIRQQGVGGVGVLAGGQIMYKTLLCGTCHTRTQHRDLSGEAKLESDTAVLVFGCMVCEAKQPPMSVPKRHWLAKPDSPLFKECFGHCGGVRLHYVTMIRRVAVKAQVSLNCVDCNTEQRPWYQWATISQELLDDLHRQGGVVVV